MIAVIADDLTGAAELGGLGLKYHVKVEIVTEVPAGTNADLLIVSADTRSGTEAQAISKIRQITEDLLGLKPELVYKKTDSVLRGHVIAELKTQMEVMQFSRALLVPSNPDLGRTIKNGHCYFKDQPIHLSSFANDPEFPIRSSSVSDILGTKEVTLLNKSEYLPGAGISIGEVEHPEDLKSWAEKRSDGIILAGAAAFFAALLDQSSIHRKNFQENVAEPGAPKLFVCGTTFNKSREAVEAIHAIGGPVSYMPDTIKYADWCNEIVSMLSSTGKAIIAIKEKSVRSQANAIELRARTAIIVEQVMRKAKIKELVIEGGSTAASIIEKLQVTKLFPVKELSAGVIRMRVEGKAGLYLTIKPGSYSWPKGLWPFESGVGY